VAPGGRRLGVVGAVILSRPPRTDGSEVGLIEAIVADQVASRIEDPEIPVEAHLDADVSWAVAPIADTFRNVVVGARFEPEDADRRIAEIRDAYGRGDTGFVWWVAPFDAPHDLGTRLIDAGLTLEGNAPAMAANLDDVPLDEPPPDGLEIVPVTDAGTLEEFLTIVEADWLEWTGGEATPVQRRTLDAFAREIPRRLPTEPAPLRWLGRVNGQPVATSRVSLGGGAAGLYAILTLPSHRGRGIGRAMSLAALRTAAGLGYRIGVLQASDLGYSVYLKLGFRDLFTYEIYVHPAPME
jgi:GNAT superfamily N-acetyltransferase